MTRRDPAVLRTQALAAVLVVLALGAATAGAPAGIAAASLLDHIKFLSSDELQGRGNGTPGLETAANYVAEQFAAAGLQPGGVDGGWFQPFELNAGVTVGAGNELVVRSRSKQAAFTLGTSYYPLASPFSEDERPLELRDLPLVFAGYGIAVPNVGYDDYARIDVNGKAVLIFSHEPQEADPASRFNGTRPMPQTSLAAKAGLARSKGARLLLVVGDPSHRTDTAPYAMFNGDPDAEEQSIPVLRLRRQEVQPLVDEWRLDALARLIDRDLVPRSEELRGATVTYVEALAKNRRTVRNVVGVLPGSDPARAREAVVIGAHYDHVGTGGRLSVSPERTGEIHNGADDNASGTASIIEIGRAAAGERERFPRTLVFVAFAGEERGLLGSARYAESPYLPMADTLAMLNLDMVGRAKGSVDISGLETSPSLEADLAAAVKASGSTLRIRREGPGAGRSDDYNFIVRRVPGINFFTGFHADYHRPGDDWEKIDAPGTSQVAALAFELAAQIAGRQTRPEFVPPRN